MKYLLLLSLLIIGSLHAALIPPERLADWTPGVSVGVPGGLERFRPGGANNRSNIITVNAPTGGADAQPAIQAAINSAPANSVVFVPAGTYRLNNQISLGYNRDNITLRGAGPDKTIFQYYGASGAVIYIGGESNYQWNVPLAAITGNPTKGATTLSMTDTSQVPVGMLARISLNNSTDPKIPVLASHQAQRRQMVRVTAKTASSITISPALAFDLPATLSPKIACAQNSFQTEFAGVEDLAVDASNSPTPRPLILLCEAFGSWAYNVRATNTQNYNLGVWDSLQCSVVMCDVRTRKGSGSNGAGFLVNNASSCLFEDNIIVNQFPLIEINQGSTANVFAYNFMLESGPGCALNTNHGPHNSFNLYEGNASPNIQADGYFGSVSQDTVFRNWFHGQGTGWTNSLNRGARNYNLVANIFGSPSQTAQYSFGNPNMGNSLSTGTAQPNTGKWWADWKTTGVQTALPTGFQERDLDVEASTLKVGNYLFGIGKEATSETIPASMFRSAKPAYFGSLAWPPFDPDNRARLLKLRHRNRHRLRAQQPHRVPQMTAPASPPFSKPFGRSMPEFLFCTT